MGEPSAALEADLAAVAAIAQRSQSRSDATMAAIAYVETRHRLDHRCRLPDHLAAMAREAERDAEARADILATIIRTVLDGLDLPEPSHTRALDLLVHELRRHAGDGAES